MSDLVQLKLSRVFTDFRERVERLQDAILRGAQPIIRRNWALSVRQRWYRTGATLQSAVDEFVTDGDRKVYRLRPTAFYAIFGEYGTGRRGAATGRPAPVGYRYGAQAGMAARRFSRIAVSIARPQVNLMAQRKVRQFAQNVTVS